MRKFVIALIIFLSVVFIFTRLTEMQSIGETLQQGDWHYLLLALILEIVWLFNVAVSYWSIYRTVGLKEKIDTLLLASSGAYFVNVIAPTAGMSGMAVFLSTARRRGYSTGRTAVANFLYLFFDYLGFILVLILGLSILFRRNTLTNSELIGAAVLIGSAIVFSALLIIGMRSRIKLANIFASVIRFANRILGFLHRQQQSEDKAREFAFEISDGLQDVRKRPGSLFFPAFLAINSKFLLILILLFMFKAFSVPLSIGTLIASFSIGYLFLIVSPTPAGLGMVEGALTLALSSMYIPLGAAAVVALAYRAVTFWVPLAIGGLSLRILERVQIPLIENSK
jgi:glycosyltransferase 2 family protein